VAAIIAALVLGVLCLLDTAGALPGPNVEVDPPSLLAAYSTPTIVADPRNPGDLVAVYRQDRPKLSARLSRSTDGGNRWSTITIPLPEGDSQPFEPDAAFAPDGTLYVTYVNLTGKGNVPANLWLASSTDGGSTLSTPQLVSSGLTFQPRIAVGAGGAVHLTWLQAHAAGPGRVGVPVVTPVGIMSATSTNGGRSFSPPVAVSAAARPFATGAVPVAYGHGDLSIAYEQFGTAPLGLGNGGSAPTPEPYSLEVATSTDGGSSFGPPVVVQPKVVSQQRFSLLLAESPSVAAGPRGALYLAWAATLGGEQDVVVSHSIDHGEHWSPPVRANNNPENDGSSRSLPAVSVAPDGRVDVAFLDRRNDPLDIYAEAYLAYSYDNGQTFTNVAVSSVAFDTNVGPSFGGDLPTDLGGHLGLVSGDAGVRVAWADSRLGTSATGRQDIFTALVTIPGSGHAGRLALAAGAAAALLVGMALWFGPTVRRLLMLGRQNRRV
jgi:hypothetical protein